jgi:hypothetical protein
MSIFRCFRGRLAAAAALASVAALTSACAHVPVASALRLAAFDPMTTDPDALRAAIAAPAEALPPKGGARLVLTQARRDGSQEEKLEIALEQLSPGVETERAGLRAKPGQEVRVFRIGATDLPRFVETRARMLARKTAAPGVWVGTLSVGIDRCRPAGTPAPKALRVSTWLRTAESGGFVTILDDVDLVPLIGPDRLTAETAACSGA